MTAPAQTGAALKVVEPFARGTRFASGARAQALPQASQDHTFLRAYFEANTEGPGIYKWLHYFEIYQRYLQRFVGTDVHIMEVGIYSGGSLPMWRQYFGDTSMVYGVDIEPACKIYEADRTKVLIGDQGDRAFWSGVRKDVPRIDVLIDDGGHHPEQQIVTFEELFPHLRPGGVYICEDTGGVPNYFNSYAAGVASQLNGMRPSRMESLIDSVHIYPGICVFEKRSTERVISSERRGTQWQPITFD